MKKLIFVMSLALVLISCQNDDRKKLIEAQVCLDQMASENNQTVAGALRCEQIIAGLNSQQANAVKCSARFIQGGITNDRLVAAFSSLSGGGSAQQQMVAMLSMSSTTAANSAFEACNASGTSGLIFISTLSKMGTDISAATGGAGCNPANCNESSCSCTTDFTACTGDNACEEQIGQSASLMGDLYCGGQNNPHPMCKSYNTAIVGLDPNSPSYNQQLGDAFLANMNN